MRKRKLNPKFKVGDHVERSSSSFAGMKVGDRAIVMKVLCEPRMYKTHYILSGYGDRQHSEANLKLVASTGMENE